LAGCEKAIVTDIEGTTRDWVSCEILMGPLAATVIDTAGLDADAVAASHDEMDPVAQARSVEILQRADLILLVMDLSRPEIRIDNRRLETLAGKRVLTVLNKSDLPTRLDTTSLPADLGAPVRIIASRATGLDDLIGAIGRTLGVADLDPHVPIAFTPRQRTLLERLASTAAPSDPAATVSTLLHGPIEG
jgi:tRNA modification GTPase